MRILKYLLIACVVALGAALGFLHAAPETVTRLAVNAERQQAGLVRKEIDLPDGLHCVYLDGGSGAPLILLHGFGGNKDNFTRVARRLTPRYRVIIPDLTGFGESSHPADADYTAVAQAARLHALVQALGLQRPDLGGNSMGGHIALAYASLYPNETASLWLLDPAGVWSAPKSELAGIIARTGHNPLIAHNAQEFEQTVDFVMNDPPWIPHPVLNVMAREAIANAPLAERIFQQTSHESVEERARGLGTPTLIVWGRQDRAINVATADVLHRLMPRSQVRIMDGVGHMPMLERPQQSADDYLRFRAAL